MDEKRKRQEHFRRKVQLQKRILRWWESWCLVIVSVVLFLAGGSLGWLVRGIGVQEVETAPMALTEPLVVVRYATEQEQAERDRQTVEALAQTVWGEARGCSTTEQAAVVWCILNRVDSSQFPDDPLMVVQQERQFDGYHPSYPVEPELVVLVEDVMARWEMEDKLVGEVGRVLPKEYLFFEGDGSHNHFRQEYIKTGETWDWSLPSPY